MPLPQAPVNRLEANRRGIALMSLSIGAFIINDAIVKYVSQSLGATQLIFIRGASSLVMLLCVAHAMGVFKNRSQVVKDFFQWPIQRRSILDACASLIYLSAVFHLPLANATAINMATPIFISLLASFALKESIPLQRWLIIVTGFTGVLLIVQPATDSFNIWAVVCVSGTLLHAIRDVSTRSISSHIPSILITLSTAITVTISSGVLSIFEGWTPPSLIQLLWLAISAVFLSLGHYLLIRSSRAGEMSVIAPFRYVGLIFAVVLGYAIWGDIPNWMAWLGIALLVIAGIMMLRSIQKNNDQ